MAPWLLSRTAQSGDRIMITVTDGRSLFHRHGCHFIQGGEDVRMLWFRKLKIAVRTPSVSPLRQEVRECGHRMDVFWRQVGQSIGAKRPATGGCRPDRVRGSS